MNEWCLKEVGCPREEVGCLKENAMPQENIHAPRKRYISGLFQRELNVIPPRRVFCKESCFLLVRGALCLAVGGLGTWKLLRMGWDLRSGMERGGHLERKRLGGEQRHTRLGFS